MKVITVGALFDTPPSQWGLRGDPYLWDELRRHFNCVQNPESAAELELLLTNAFFELTGKSLSETGHFRVERYAHGGMSSGHVCPEFWSKKAFPLLLARFSGQSNLLSLEPANRRKRRNP